MSSVRSSPALALGWPKVLPTEPKIDRMRIMLAIRAAARRRSRWVVAGTALALLALMVFVYWLVFGKGVVQVKAGNRELTEVAMAGEFSSTADPKTVWSIGQRPRIGGEVVSVREWKLPRGDYYPSMMWFRFGRLEFVVSQNYHADGVLFGALNGAGGQDYPIRIRKYRPYVFDFSNRPEVMFVAPGKEQTFWPGEEVKVKAVLVDPVLHTMLRSLHDASQCSEYGEAYVKDLFRLDPTVTISDESGRQMAKGTMPFG